MLAIIGDVHRSFGLFAEIVASLPRNVDTIIQVGDLELRASDLRAEKSGDGVLQLARCVHCIDGNWDDFGGLGLRDLSEPTELLTNLVYVPRGTVLTLGGQRIGFLGGAESIATETRVAGRNWWPDLEGVRDSDVERLVESAASTGGLDLIIAHTPPARATERMTGQVAHSSAFRVQQAQTALLGAHVVAGHMHRSWRDPGPPAVTVLNELEAIVI